MLERLSCLNEDESESNQIQYQLAAFEDQEENLKDWFSRFNNLKVYTHSALDRRVNMWMLISLQTVDSNSTDENTYVAVDSIVQDLIAKKNQPKEGKAVRRVRDGGERATPPSRNESKRDLSCSTDILFYTFINLKNRKSHRRAHNREASHHAGIARHAHGGTV